MSDMPESNSEHEREKMLEPLISEREKIKTVLGFLSEMTERRWYRLSKKRNLNKQLFWAYQRILNNISKAEMQRVIGKPIDPTQFQSNYVVRDFLRMLMQRDNRYPVAAKDEKFFLIFRDSSTLGEVIEGLKMRLKELEDVLDNERKLEPLDI